MSVLDEAAMENAYNICHNVQDLLYFRGFFWEGSGGKGKKVKCPVKKIANKVFWSILQQICWINSKNPFLIYICTFFLKGKGKKGKKKK